MLICTLLVLSIYELSLAHARQACSDEGATIETVWNEGVREQLRTAFLATGSPNAAATVENVPHYFDTRATEWREVRTEICVHTTIEKDWSSELTNKGLWCLVQHKVAMDELLKQLLKTDVENIHNAVRAASKLRESSNCSNPFYLYTLPKLPHNPEIFRPLVQQLQRTEAVLRAGNFQEAEELAQATLKNALKVERSPLIARAYLSLGTALSRTGKYAESEKALEEAFFRAVVDDAYEIAADATIALMDTVGQRMVRFDDGLRWWRQFEAYDTHLEQQSTRIRRGHALGALAGLYFQNGDYSESITTLEKSLQIRRDTQGEEHPYYASGLINLSLIHETMGHYDEALALGQRALEIKQKVHGEKHPSVVNALVAVA
ncbi:MAG: tetratricopeptide repeat protein, partial [Nannocystaceae bacterium]